MANQQKKRTRIIASGLVVVVALIFAIVVAVGGGGDSGTTLAAGEYQAVSSSGTALVPLEDPDNDPARGVVAPQLTGSRFDGSGITVAPTGNPTLVVFLAHWCPHCNAEIPRLIEWKESGKMPANLQVVGVSTGARNDQPNWPPSQWLVEKKWPWDAMADSEDQLAAVALGVSGYPGLVLLDGDGKVLARRSGEASINELDAWAAEFLAL